MKTSRTTSPMPIRPLLFLFSIIRPFGARLAAWLLLAGFLMTLPAQAAEIHAGPADDVLSLLRALQPGDELVLATGTYTLTARYGFTLAGTPEAPITVRAADGADVLFHRPDAAQNIWDFSGTYATVRGLRFSGGSAGLRIEGADHLTIEDCEIFDTADVALRLNDTGVTYAHVTIRRNHIHHTGGTGEGMYLGCNSDACRLRDSLIEGNWVHHTNGPGVSQGDGIELKEGSFHNVIRDNVVHDTNYPCILTYSTVGNGPANVIEGNLLWNCGDHGIQSAQDAVIANNIILGAAADGISLQPHQAGVPGNQRVVHNTVFNAAGSAIVVRNATGDVVVANNAVYTDGAAAIRIVGPDATIVIAGNVGAGGLDGSAQPGLAPGDLASDFVSAHLGGVPPIDAFPAPSSALIGAADARYVTVADFNGTLREDTLDAGAYRYDPAGNPGWTLEAGFKETSPAPPPCGNGTLDPGEECDDANTVSGDGCSAACTRENPSPCGNGTLDPGEECDDANTVSGDGCSAACTREETGAKSGDGCSCLIARTPARGISGPALLLLAFWLARAVRPPKRATRARTGKKPF